ncbi:MAG: SGNH/GDSL hydrolase family protein [Acetobacteraceae bacterium]
MFPDSQASDQSFRMIVRPQAPGQRVRLRFSNLMGSKPVTFDNVSIATRANGKSLVAGTSVPLTFNGSSKVTIDRGAELYCDAVAFDVVPERDVAVSFHVVGDSGPITWHAKAMTTSYLSAPGAGAQLDSGTSLTSEVRSWLWLTELQAFQPNVERHAIVAIGDSITDGSGTTIDGNDRWEDFLNKRLRGAGSANVVVNEGIGGNRVVTMPWGPVLSGAYTSEAKLADHSGAPNTTDARCDGCGEPAVVRLERDVFGLPNVSAIILFEGVNDIGAGASYAQVIAGMQDIVQRAHARGIKVFAATITPYYGFAYDQVYPDLTRQQVNNWIRTSRTFDAVFDFDAAVRDPSDPARIKADYSAPDHIHLNPTGYERAAATVTLSDLDGTIKQ